MKNMGVSKLRWGCLFLQALLMGIGLAQAKSKQVPLNEKQVPVEVLSAFRKDQPGVKAVAWTIKKGKYKAAFNLGQHAKFLKFDSEGAILERAEELKPEQIPSAVKDACARAYPRLTVKRVLSIQKDGGTKYKVRFKGKKEVLMDETGTLLKESAGREETFGRAGEGPRAEASSGGPTVYGFVQMHYRFAFPTGTGPTDHDNARVQRVRLGVKGDVSPRVSYQVEIDPRAPEIAGILRDAYASCHLTPTQDIRFGQQKTLFGYESRASSTELYFVNRTEYSDNIAAGPVTTRDVGVGWVGHIPCRNGLRIENALTVVNGNGMNTQGDNTGTKNISTRWGLRWKKGASVTRLGLSYGAGDFIDEGFDADSTDDDYRQRYQSVGLDFEADRPSFFLAAEVGQASYVAQETPAIVGTLPPGEVPIVKGERDEPIGYYLILAGKTRWNAGPVLRYDALDTYRRLTLGAYVGDPKAAQRFLVNYEIRLNTEDSLGVEGRGDDKLYCWYQFKF